MSQIPAPQKDILLVIGPSQPWYQINLPELWQYREMLFFLVWRNIKVRYKQTLVGFAWAVVQPLFAAIIFSCFFGRMSQIPSDGVPYILFSYSALVPWTFFSGALSLASSSLISDANLVRKIYFPRLILPITASVTGWLDLTIAGGILLAMMGWFHALPDTRIFVAPIFVLMATVTAFSVSLWLSALDVKYHDVRYTIPFITQIWMFISPVIYPPSMVLKKLHIPLWIYGINPMASVVSGFRWCVSLGPAPESGMLAASTVSVLILLVSGIWYFKRTERFFADVI